MIRTKSARKALTHVLAAALVVFGFSSMMNSISWDSLYNYRFAFVPGHWLRAQLNEIEKPDVTCLIVGTSAAREGFDAAVLSAANNGAPFVDIATTGSTAPLDVFDIQSTILQREKAHYRCIIVAVDNFYLKRFDATSYDITKSDYLSQLSIWDAFRWRVLAGGSSKRVLFTRLMMPLGKHNVMLQRLWRYGLFLARKEMVDPNAQLASHELFKRELLPAKQFWYSDKPSNFEKATVRSLAVFAQYEMKDSSVYEGPETALMLRTVLARYSAMTDHLIVVRMPLSSVYRSAEVAAEVAFEKAIAAADYDVLLDCPIAEDSERGLFYDTAHVNEKGRLLVSSSVAPFISATINKTPLPAQNGICSLMK